MAADASDGRQVIAIRQSVPRFMLTNHWLVFASGWGILVLKPTPWV